MTEELRLQALRGLKMAQPYIRGLGTVATDDRDEVGQIIAALEAPPKGSRDLGVVITGSRQVADLWYRDCIRVLCHGMRETAVGDAAALRASLENAVSVIRDLADIAEGAGIKPAPGWAGESGAEGSTGPGMNQETVQ